MYLISYYMPFAYLLWYYTQVYNLKYNHFNKLIMFQTLLQPDCQYSYQYFKFIGYNFFETYHITCNTMTLFFSVVNYVCSIFFVFHSCIYYTVAILHKICGIYSCYAADFMLLVLYVYRLGWVFLYTWQTGRREVLVYRSHSIGGCLVSIKKTMQWTVSSLWQIVKKLNMHSQDQV